MRICIAKQYIGVRFRTNGNYAWGAEVKTLQALVLLAVIATLGSLCAGGWYERHLLHDMLWNVRSASWNLSETSKVLKDNSAASSEMEKKILGEVSLFIKETNTQVYGVKAHPGLVPQMTTLVAKAQPVMDNLNSATAKLNTALYDLDELIKSGNTSVQELNDSEKRIETLIGDIDSQVKDPVIKQILAQLLEAAQNGAKATNEFAATTTDIRQIADKAKETYLKPVNLWWGLVKELLPLAGSAAQVIK